jgi:hypothetical protein
MILYGMALQFVCINSWQLLGLSDAAPSSTHRRKLWSVGSVWTVVTAATIDCANAVSPITQFETETGTAKAMRLLRSNPPKILRQRISRDFAVLLMRTSYSVTDELDIIPMNQFQRDFFLIRSAEYEPYIQSLGPGFVQQGDLSDPSYFDFISLSQYLTINRAMSDPAVIFQELQPVVQTESDKAKDNIDTPQQFETVVVRRTISNDQLVPTFDVRLGNAILQYLDETYANTPIALVATQATPNRPNVDAVRESLTQLVKLFLVNGFAWDGHVDVLLPTKSKSIGSNENDAAGTTFGLTLVSPASIWGNQSLHRQRSQLCNDYLLKTARQLVHQRMGYIVASSSVKFQDNNEISYLTLR